MPGVMPELVFFHFFLFFFGKRACILSYVGNINKKAFACLLCLFVEISNDNDIKSWLRTVSLKNIFVQNHFT